MQRLRSGLYLPYSDYQLGRSLISPYADHIRAACLYILLPSASAAQPPIKHSPPSGVTSPNILNLCGSSTSKYMLPLNIVMPATKSEAAILFLGAIDVARRRTPEWTS
jgi:hypothetical protein